MIGLYGSSFWNKFDLNLELDLSPSLCGITGSPADWKDFSPPETITDVVFAVYVCVCVGALGLIHSSAAS